MRLLLIQTDETACDNLGGLLLSAGFIFDVADTGEEGVELGKALDYDAILLDGAANDTLRRLRRAQVQTPVLVLAAPTDAESIVNTFTLGADDHVSKPFQAEELIARIRNVIRRARGLCQPVIHTGRLKLNLAAKTAKVDGKPISLTAKEYAILELLSLRKGWVVSRATLLDHLYGGVDEPETRAVDVHICHLRRKLASACGGESYIQTCWGRGFALQEPDLEAGLIAA